MSSIDLLRTRRYWPLFWVQFLGAFNDNFFKTALIALITFKSIEVFGLAPELTVAACAGIFILPFFLFSGLAGEIADKFEKSRLIRFVKIWELLIMSLAALGFWMAEYEFLVFLLFFMGLQSTIFGPLKYSMLPQILKEEELVGGNALVELGTFLAILLGTIFGGMLSLMEPHGIAVVEGGIVFFAIVGIGFAWAQQSVRATDPGLKIHWDGVRSTVKIVTYIFKFRTLYLAILGISWFWFFGATFLTTFPNYCKNVLFANEDVMTLFLALFSLGIGIGSMICGKLSGKYLELGLVPVGSIGMTLFALDLYFVGSPEPVLAEGVLLNVTQLLTMAPWGPRIVLDLLGLAIFSGFFIVPLYTLIQIRADERYRSRVIAANNIFNAFFMVVASVMIIGMLKTNMGYPDIYLVVAVLNAVVAIYIYTLLPEFFYRFMGMIVSNVMYRLKSRGRDHIPAEGPAVLVCNHVSFVDWLIIGGACKRPLRFVMHYSFYKNPIVKRILNRCKVIPIAGEKENPEILARAFERISEEIRAGNVVCIFPEGTITKTGELSDFRRGIEQILEKDPVPVIPMALNGLWGSFFSHKGGMAGTKTPKRFWSRVELVVDAPIAPEEATAAFLQRKVAGLMV